MRRLWIPAILALLVLLVIILRPRIHLNMGGKVAVEPFAGRVPVKVPAYSDFWAALGDLYTDYAGADRSPGGTGGGI